MAQINLKHTHPGLFQGILATALTHLTVGSLMLYGLLATSNHRNPTLGLFFISCFFVIAGLMLYGLFRPRYSFVRVALVAGLFLIGFLSLVFVSSIGYKVNENQTKQLAWLVPPWLFWAWTHFISMSEPPQNPMSEKQ